MGSQRPVILGLALGIALALGTGARGCVPDIRHPYVQNVTTTSATIVWKTSQPTTGLLEWGATSSYGASTATPQGNRHAVTISGLQPNTTYYYRVSVNGQVLRDNVPFRTAKPASVTDVTFMAFGDSGRWSPMMMQLGEEMRNHPVDLIIHAGDVIYPGGEEDKYDVGCFTPYRETLLSTPMFPSIGNHDQRNIQPYIDNWHLPTNQLGNERWYSFDYGHVRFISISTEDDLAPGSPQYQFIENALATSTATWNVPFFHKAVYSAGYHGDFTRGQQSLVPLFQRYDVDLVVQGHDHHYERTRPLNGIVYVVTGGASGFNYPVGSNANTAFSKWLTHFCVFRANGRTLSWEAIGRDGRVHDTFTITK